MSVLVESHYLFVFRSQAQQQLGSPVLQFDFVQHGLPEDKQILVGSNGTRTLLVLLIIMSVKCQMKASRGAFTEVASRQRQTEPNFS